MSLTFTNTSNGSTSSGMTINDKIGFTDVVTAIQNSIREFSEKVDLSEKVSIDVLPGVLKETFGFSDIQSAKIAAKMKDDLSFSHTNSADISTVIKVDLSLQDVVTLIEGYAQTISDKFILTDALEFDIISGTKDKVYLDDLVNTNIELPLSDIFLFSDNSTINLTSGTNDTLSISDRIFVIYDQSRPIGAPIAIGNKLIG